MHYLGINCNDTPLDNKNVRTALSMLMDRDTIAQTCFAGRADAAALAGEKDSGRRKGTLLQSGGSVKLLKKAGIYDRDNDGYLEIRGGSDFKLRLSIISSTAPRALCWSSTQRHSMKWAFKPRSSRWNLRNVSPACRAADIRCIMENMR